jgi:hypothetical protein
MLTVCHSDVQMSRPPLQLLFQRLFLGKGQERCKVVISLKFIVTERKDYLIERLIVSWISHWHAKLAVCNRSMQMRWQYFLPIFADKLWESPLVCRGIMGVDQTEVADRELTECVSVVVHPVWLREQIWSQTQLQSLTPQLWIWSGVEIFWYWITILFWFVFKFV